MSRKHDIIRIEDQYYILSTSARIERQTRVLKSGDTFAIFDGHGDIQTVGLGDQGLYHNGTRYLSDFELTFGQHRPLLLSSNVKRDNVMLTVDLTNTDLALPDGVSILRGTIHLFRSKLVWDGACYENLRITNHGSEIVEIDFAWHFAADFADMFEVRGLVRERRGRDLEPQIDTAKVALSYEGLDRQVRTTTITFDPLPAELTPFKAGYAIRLQPGEEGHFFVTVSATTTPPVTYADAIARVREANDDLRRGECRVHSSNEQFNNWLNQSVYDLHMMLTATNHGLYPYAGVPWFCTPFGRDGLVTALGWLWAKPTVAKGVLQYLAATQATEHVDSQDAEPGKILHETRGGEMANLGEIPFARYYGTVDATALFVFLAGRYFSRTCDKQFIESLWPHIEAALVWHERYGDRDGDGFIEYETRTPKGLAQQGWKDSGDSVFHADGAFAQGPIALCEVQAYYYGALHQAAAMADALGRSNQALELRRRAARLKERFEADFWDEELGTYVLALDGDKRPCRVRSSNAGQCLLTNIASPDRARRTAQLLMHKDLFSGWGVRTLSAKERRFNPMSYHNGSIWPHDNALIALGLANYGLRYEAAQILSGLFDASVFVDQHRMPELFCGFVRRPAEGPTAYPVACAPQAWSAVSVFMLLEAVLGMTIDGIENRITFVKPVLPEWLERVSLRDLQVGSASVDLILERHPNDVGVVVARRQGDVLVEVIK